MCSSSREVGARPCLRSHARASSRSFSRTCTVRVEYASICAWLMPRISLPRPSARGIQSTPNSRVSSHSTVVAATACSAPRTARTLMVSRARHLPSRKVRVIRAIWLWMWSWGSPSRLVPCSQEVTISPAGSNRPGSRPSIRVPW